jgi:hypothetical protein
VGSQDIAKLGALAHHHPPNAMQHRDALLLCRLHANKSDGRPGTASQIASAASFLPGHKPPPVSLLVVDILET